MNPDTNNSRRGRANAWRLGTSLVVIGLSAWLFMNRQNILDQAVLASYNPTDRIEKLAEDTTMSNQAKRYFYVSQPEINDRDEFNKNCGTENEQTIILGCYSAKKIYLFNVTDSRLPGVMEVTAAHEMLHVAYERLSESEKDRIGELIDTEVAKINNERINNLIDIYNRREPGQLRNEMHSILATEVADLSPDLEKYYGRYFENRQSVVDYSSRYESVFVELKQTQEQLAAKLDNLRQEISDRSDSLNAEITRLNGDIDDFNNRARAGDFDSQQEFDAERAALLSRQASLRVESDTINALISEFNATRDELLALNVQVQSLNQSLDSTPDDIQELQ